MTSRDNMWLIDFEDVLYKENEPVMDFSIKRKELVGYTVFREDLLPPLIKMCGVSYFTINNFYKYRVVIGGSLGAPDVMREFHMYHYDFETMARRSRGWNRMDDYYTVFRDEEWFKGIKATLYLHDEDGHLKYEPVEIEYLEVSDIFGLGHLVEELAEFKEGEWISVSEEEMEKWREFEDRAREKRKQLGLDFLDKYWDPIKKKRLEDLKAENKRKAEKT